jgi:hypothetical protein
MGTHRNPEAARKAEPMEWPNADELLAWWIYLQMDLNRLKHVEAADVLKWLADYKEKGRTKCHRILHNEYMTFRLKFRHPDK